MAEGVSPGGARVNVADVRWWLAPGESPVDLGAVLEVAAEIPRGGSGNLKSGRRKELHRIGVAGRRFLVKINHYPKATVQWLHKNSDTPALFRQRPARQPNCFSTF